MSRIRTIKPGFFKNEQLADLPMQVRLLFIGLWTLADKEGKLEDRPKRIKVELFPYDTLDVDNLLSRLQSAGFILRYEVGDMKVIKILNFNKHQRISGTEVESVSEFPDPAEGSILELQGSTLASPRITGKEGKGNKERKGKEAPVAQDDKPDKYFFIKKFFTEDFIPIWEKWKNYKEKEHRFKFKTPDSEEANFTELLHLSESIQSKAIAIIQQSIANGWKGLFQLKNKNNTEAEPPKQFALPPKVLSKIERDINKNYKEFLLGELKIVNMYDADFDFMIKRGMKISEAENKNIRDAVQEYMQQQRLENSESTIQSLAKRFAVIEHFKFLKQKGNESIFGVD
jgi:hypothetical protein